MLKTCCLNFVEVETTKYIYICIYQTRINGSKISICKNVKNEYKCVALRCCYTDSCNTSYINLGNESITHAHNHGFGRKNKGPRNKLTSLNTTFTAVLEHNKKKKTAKLD